MEHIDEDDDDECLDLGSKAWSRVINAAVKVSHPILKNNNLSFK